MDSTLQVDAVCEKNVATIASSGWNTWYEVLGFIGDKCVPEVFKEELSFMLVVFFSVLVFFLVQIHISAMLVTF